MKKLIALLLAMMMIVGLFAGCANEPAVTEPSETTPVETDPVETDPVETDPVETDPVVEVMTHEEYMAAAIDDEVVIEAYVQGHQAWWEDKITVYAQDNDGGYFMYEMACSEEDSAKLVPGTKIRVTGYKAEWAGEVEIVDATFEILEGSYIAEATDVTELLGTEDLVKHQNQFVVFKGMTIEAIEYKNDKPGDDIYVTVGYNGNTYDFCVEMYLTGPDSDTYKAVQALNVGDVVDIEGFLYWYEGVNTHITGVKAAA